jgi:excisionase family DNA binding protein
MNDVNQISPPSPGRSEPAKLLYNRREAGEILSVSAGTIDNMVKDGRLRPVYVGRLPRFTWTELERFAGDCPTERPVKDKELAG